MTTLSDWIVYGLKSRKARNMAMVRRWTREARGHLPVIDCVNYPGQPILTKR